MAGQSVAAFWPLESRTILANLILEARADGEGRSVQRSLASDGILRDPLVTVWRAGDDRPDRLFVAVDGAADDDRSYLYLRASEARYRQLINIMSVATAKRSEERRGRKGYVMKYSYRGQQY